MNQPERDPAATDELPRLLAAHPGLCERLMAHHVARPDGQCRGCRSEVGPGANWPCRLYSAAAEGVQIGAAPRGPA